MKLILDHIEKSFQNKQVLKNASFTFEQGKIYGLLGRNGAGKTTLFNCISGDLTYESGSIYLSDEGENTMSVDYSKIGYIFSEPILPDFLTGYEFIKFFIDINQDKLKNALPIEGYFDLMKIAEEDRYRLLKRYSRGMKNKIQMLCCFITRPPIILLDEPLTSLDVVVAAEIKSLLKQIKKDHVIIFSTHILHLAMDLCDEIVLLHKGVLELADKRLLKSTSFEKELLGLLKEEDDV